IGAAIAEVLDQHGALSAAEISERIKATGRDIDNRSVSFALQALKKRGLAKNTDGKWAAPKARGRRGRPMSSGNAADVASAG
ncbi:MAG: winged-helix domain-containing protein, partial [Hyphomicrobium sp.]